MTELAVIRAKKQIVLPRPAEYAIDRHHTFWPKPDYKRKANRFRGLECLIVRVDAEAHKALHFCYDPPRRPDPKIMEEAKARHRSGECSCEGHRDWRKQEVNLLGIKEGAGADIPCMEVRLDPWVLGMITDHSAKPKPLPQEWAEYLVDRHRKHMCACIGHLQLVAS